jgi:hypothetical protein
MNQQQAEFEERTKTKLRSVDTELLVFIIEALNNCERNPERTLTRAWVVEELEARNMPACNAWLDSDEDSPRRFFFPPTAQDPDAFSDPI